MEGLDQRVPVAEANISLSGWKAIAGLALILVIPGIRLAIRFQTVPDEGRDAIRAWLVDEYEGRGMKALVKMANDYQAGMPLHIPERPAVAPDVNLVSVAAHGSPGSMIARVEVTVDGAGPPDELPVRYLHLVRKFGGGWMVTSETSEFRYYQALID